MKARELWDPMKAIPEFFVSKIPEKSSEPKGIEGDGNFPLVPV